MIGKDVTAVRPLSSGVGSTDTLVTGTVKKVLLQDGVYYLGVQEANGNYVQVQMGNVLTIEGGTGSGGGSEGWDLPDPASGAQSAPTSFFPGTKIPMPTPNGNR